MKTARTDFRRSLVGAAALGLVGAAVGCADNNSTAASTPDGGVSGPYVWTNVRTGASGGFIVDVVFNPTERDLIYAKTDMGGVYRYSPADRTWIQLMNWVGPDDWGLTGGESIATDPVDPDRFYVAAGTYTNDWDPQNGAILRSRDRGETFEITRMPFKMGGNMPGRGMGERLAIDPNDNRILYFGARDEQGLWRSTDFGETWDQVEDFPETGPYVQDPEDSNGYLNHAVGIPWVVFDPSTGSAGSATQTIYVGAAQNGSGLPNVFRSTDGGATWEPIPGQPTCAVAGDVVTCTGGATWDMTALGDDGQPGYRSTGYLPKQGKLDSAGTLYVTYSNFAGPYDGNVGDVWKFEPATSTWTQISPVRGSEPRDDMFWGYGGIAIDLQRPGTLVVSTVNQWWPEGNLYRSTDGGGTWRAAWEWAGYPDRTSHFTMDISSAPWLDLGVTAPVPPDPRVNIGWMMEGMNIDPFDSDRMMYGTGATLYGTTELTRWDAGQTFVIQSMAVGIEETSVLGLVSPPSGTAHLYSVVGDVGGWRHDDLDVAPAAGFTVPYSGTNNDIDFAESMPSLLVRVGTGEPAPTWGEPYTGSAFSFDGGESWVAGATDPLPGEGAGTVAMSADGSSVVWAGTNAPVSFSTDAGASWQPSTGIPAGASVASDRVNGNKYYGLSGGSFWVSSDAGATFTASGAPGLPARGKVEAVFGREGDVWLTGADEAREGAACTTCGLWHTTDSGVTLTKLANVTTADAIGFGLAMPGGSDYPAVFLAGTVDGVRAIFRSDDAGATWTRINDERHQFATIQTLTGDPRVPGRVYLGTNGLGIVHGDIAE